MREPRPPFHPLRLVDLVIENWWKLGLSIGTLVVAVLLASAVHDATGSIFAWAATVAVVLALGTSIIPRNTMYGRPIGVGWNGWLYRRLKSGNEGGSDDAL